MAIKINGERVGREVEFAKIGWTGEQGRKERLRFFGCRLLRAYRESVKMTGCREVQDLGKLVFVDIKQFEGREQRQVDGCEIVG